VGRHRILKTSQSGGQDHSESTKRGLEFNFGSLVYIAEYESSIYVQCQYYPSIPRRTLELMVVEDEKAKQNGANPMPTCRS
jgi:hypothetical protein